MSKEPTIRNQAGMALAHTHPATPVYTIHVYSCVQKKIKLSGLFSVNYLTELFHLIRGLVNGIYTVSITNNIIFWSF